MLYYSNNQVKLFKGDNAVLLKSIAEKSIDLVITSPPYDSLRKYKGYVFDFNIIAYLLCKVLKDGGTIVWIVNDETINGSRTGTSFKQALYFKELGLNLHDTMIWNKRGFTSVGSMTVRYPSVFDYMFIFTKGKIKTFNPLIDRRNITNGKISGNIRQKDGTLRSMSNQGKERREYGVRFNIWDISANTLSHNMSMITRKHPATFPLVLVEDHIKSWSNFGDTILDCFMGSGTTAIACMNTGRKCIGIEISEEYCQLTKDRILKNTIQYKIDKIKK